MLPRSIAVLAVLLVAGSAHAERRTSVMVEPIYLVMPMVDATIEREVTPHIGIAGVAGYGKILMISTLWELGAQANYYPLRDFDGLHFGSELRVLGGDMKVPLFGGPDSMSYAREKRAAIYAGYKWVTSRGFTAVLQLGVGRLDMKSSTESWSKIMPAANLNAGWSF